MQDLGPPDLTRRTRRAFTLTLAACGLAGGTGLVHAQAKAGAEPGAKDLFFAPGPAENVALRATSAQARPAAPPRSDQAAPRVGAAGLRVWLTETSDTSGSRHLSPQQVFRTGSSFRLWLEANRDGYLYLVNVGSSGATRLMFPRQDSDDNRITGRTPFTLGSSIRFGEPAGTEQLIVVLSSTKIDDAPVQLRDGSFTKVSVRPGGSTALPPARRAPAQGGGGSGGGRDAASASLDLALADLRGAKDLKFDDDGSELIAVSRQSDDRPGAYAPVVINLRLTHR